MEIFGANFNSRQYVGNAILDPIYIWLVEVVGGALLTLLMADLESILLILDQLAKATLNNVRP